MLQTCGLTALLHMTKPPAMQFTHATPPEPHCVSLSLTTHVVAFAQQPVQFAGPHGRRHVRVMGSHTRPGKQFAQASPFGGPHALSWVPAAHTLALQHPMPAQFAGPHASG